MQSVHLSRFTFYVSRCLLVFLVAVTVLIPDVSAQEVDIPDPNLERAIRENLALPDEVPITQPLMHQLIKLDASRKKIETIIGLEHATHLTELLLPANQIRDITPLAGLIKLQLLSLIANPIDNISPLSNLTQLKYLYLGSVTISDLSPLSNLTQLMVLNLAYCRQIRDITPLSNLTQLNRLEISRNQITDITPLANLTALETLTIEDNRITDITPLANLTALKKLWIEGNQIVDFSPLQGLSLTNLRYDQVCVLSGLPIQDRIQNRNLPSIMTGWHHNITGQPESSYDDLVAYHDLFWHALPFGLRFQQSPPWSKLTGDLNSAIARRDELLARNPNMLFLAEIRMRNAHPDGQYPEDWFGWVRDEHGNPILGSARQHAYLIDLRLPEVQDIIVQQAISVAQCGLYDGIMFDGWNIGGFFLIGFNEDGSIIYNEHVEENISLSISQRIRESVPEDFLIIVNTNWDKIPLTAPYINGGHMETGRDTDSGYTNTRLAEIEDTLLWQEAHLREPQIICLLGQGILNEPPDSPANLRQMRLFTTMSLTLSDGYVLYTIGGRYQDHIWYDFWDADLGQPVGPTAQQYNNIAGIYIREFTNGWAVYNRSGGAQTITLPQSSTGVSSRKQETTHLLPNLDGEIYLRVGKPFDLNRDGTINVLDLLLVSQHFGTTAGDVNGDGITDILDLTLVAQQFNQ